jgi:hypothetical protein
MIYSTSIDLRQSIYTQWIKPQRPVSPRQKPAHPYKFYPKHLHRMHHLLHYAVSGSSRTDLPCVGNTQTTDDEDGDGDRDGEQ